MRADAGIGLVMIAEEPFALEETRVLFSLTG